jgi:hypothetical protein
MNRIIKSVILLSGILLLISCKEDLAEGKIPAQYYRGRKKFTGYLFSSLFFC